VKEKNRGSLVATIILAFFAILTIAPFYIMIATSTKDQMGFITNFWGVQFPINYINYIKTWTLINGYIFNSIKVTVLTVIGIILVSIPAGFAFAKMNFPGKEKTFTLIMAFKMIPATLLLIPMFINIIALKLNDTHMGVMLPNIAMGSIVSVILVRGFFEALPDSIFESARLDGANEIKIMSSIVVPMSKPIIGTVALFNFFGVFNQFMWPYIVLSSNELKTIPIGLNSLLGQYGVDFGLQMAAYTIVSIPLVILIASTMKVYVSGITTGAVKG
jgi:multiple sugar transport system permease protein/raffinose/stachyose/melibiose transport system permease protein